jgi:signal transduction histidine kinase
MLAIHDSALVADVDPGLAKSARRVDIDDAEPEAAGIAGDAVCEMHATVPDAKPPAGAPEIGSDDLLSIVSHDLRTPLSVIQSAVPLLLESAADAADQASIRRTAAMIVRASARMSRMIEDLLDRTRMETGKLKLDRARFTLSDVLADVADLRPLAVQKEIRLEILPARDADTVSCDRARIDQVLFNLVSNAIKCSRPGTGITVSAERIGAGACFAVRDQGRGMTPETLSKIFERFWQPAGSSHTGLGLGLYIAKGIVEAHGGGLRAESILGEGSTFYCYIPD